MAYDEYNFDNSSNSVMSDISFNVGDDETEYTVIQERIDGVPLNLGDNAQLQLTGDSTDYSEYYATIISNQELELAYLSDIRDNSFRLYYFLGGLYVAFAIIIGIKFFKTFLF